MTTPTTAEAMIYEALMVHLSSLVLDPVLPIADPNVSFESPDDRMYLEASFMPARTQRRFIVGSEPHIHMGLLQVTVVWPVDQGASAPLEVAGQVAEHFAADTLMVYSGATVRSVADPTVGSPMTGKTDLRVPVSVAYECYV